jgi:restriction system protein
VVIARTILTTRRQDNGTDERGGSLQLSVIGQHRSWHGFSGIRLNMSRRKSSLADDLVLVPWWISLILALFAFVFLSAMPLPWSAFVPLAVLFFLATAALSARRSIKTARMLEGQTSLASLRQLPWKRFEDLLGEAYRRQGYKVEETLGGGADGGVDLILGRDGKVTLVQCKRWNGAPVGVRQVRELYGVLHDRGANAAKLVATTSFTPDAVAFAENKPIELVDADSLLHLIRGVQTSGKIVLPTTEADNLTPDCPKCGSVMVLREAKRGANVGQKFWGCANFPKCHGTRNL